MVVDLETESFLDINPAACNLLGYSREELLSMRPEDIHPNDVERGREEFIKSKENTRAFRRRRMSMFWSYSDGSSSTGLFS